MLAAVYCCVLLRTAVVQEMNPTGKPHHDEGTLQVQFLAVSARARALEFVCVDKLLLPQGRGVLDMWCIDAWLWQLVKPPARLAWESCVAATQLWFHTTARAYCQSCVVPSKTFSHRATTSLSPCCCWPCLPPLAAVRQLLLYSLLVMLLPSARSTFQLHSCRLPCSSS